MKKSNSFVTFCVFPLVSLICGQPNMAIGAVQADYATIGVHPTYPSPMPGAIFAGEIPQGGWFTVGGGGGFATLTAATWFVADEFIFTLSSFGYEHTSRPISPVWMANGNGAAPVPVSFSFDTPQYFAVYEKDFILGDESFGWFSLTVSPFLEVQGLGSAINRSGPGIRVGTLEAIPEPSVLVICGFSALGILVRKRPKLSA